MSDCWDAALSPEEGGCFDEEAFNGMQLELKFQKSKTLNFLQKEIDEQQEIIDNSSNPDLKAAA